MAASRSAKPRLVIDRQAMNHQAGAAVHQGRRRLEVAGLPSNESAAGIIQLDLTGGPAAGQGLQLVVDVVECKGEPIGLDGRGDGKRARLAAAIEMTAYAVSEASLLAQLRIEPRGELTAQDLVQDQRCARSRGRIRASPRWPARTTACGAPGRSSKSKRRPVRRTGCSTANTGARVRDDGSRWSQLVGKCFRVNIAGDDDRRVGREQEPGSESSPDRPE